MATYSKWAFIGHVYSKLLHSSSYYALFGCCHSSQLNLSHRSGVSPSVLVSLSLSLSAIIKIYAAMLATC